ncbi:MAG: phosphoenolpyruvate mutase [Acetatifactor sp.]|nr:phosphoenolpyruvate mutase [Acetatifactor sp.]
MKALILNSGMGSRMGVLTSEHPKCMTEISSRETILSRQLKQIASAGIEEVVMTTGLFDSVLVNYCQSLDLPLHITFVKNPLYQETNYIYSIYCAREYLEDDILLMHGDLVFENAVFDAVVGSETSCMTISTTLPLPEKDFKAVLKDDRIAKVGIEFFTDAVAAQPLYKLRYDDWKVWLEAISAFCESDKVKCYAENAFNEVSDACKIYPLDVKNQLCSEIDTPEDLAIVSERLKEVENRTVYMCFSTDILHSGHISIIKKAERLGKLIVGILSDEAVASYKRFPLLPFSERKAMFENIAGVYRVVEQNTLSYKENLEKYQPAYVVHGDDWATGFQKPIRDEVVSVLASYGGRLVEFPYSGDEKYRELEQRARAELSMPDMRRGRLKKAITMKGTVTAIEAHSGLTGLIAENTVVYQDGAARQFDAMWISSLCDSTAKGKPDIELVDMTSRFRTIDDIMEVTTKPIIFDGDTGGLTEHFVYTVRTLERMGVSMIIIEDKTGLKKNSLFGNEVVQTQDSIPNFCEKIAAGKKAQKTQDFMICARIESLILEQGMEDALERAFAFVGAGADAIMIHSRKKEPDEIFEFVEKFRAEDSVTPIVVVPTSFNMVTEEEFKQRGVNVVIYANQLTRTGFPAMQNAAKMILENHRAKECDDICMPFKDIIRLIPEDN